MVELPPNLQTEESGPSLSLENSSTSCSKQEESCSPRVGGFLAVGIPPLPDPEWLQAGALAGALDSPCGGTLDFFDFF